MSGKCGACHDEVRESLAKSEHAFVHRIASAFRELGDLLGYRPRDGMTFEILAALAQSTMRGTVTVSMSTPEFGKPLVGLGVAGVVLAYLEPDTAIKWNEARMAEIEGRLRGS